MANTKAASKSAAKKKMTKKEQSARFIETARKLEVDQSGKAFDGVFRKLVPAREKLD